MLSGKLSGSQGSSPESSPGSSQEALRKLSGSSPGSSPGSTPGSSQEALREPFGSHFGEEASGNHLEVRFSENCHPSRLKLQIHIKMRILRWVSEGTTHFVLSFTIENHSRHHRQHPRHLRTDPRTLQGPLIQHRKNPNSRDCLGNNSRTDQEQSTANSVRPGKNDGAHQETRWTKAS